MKNKPKPPGRIAAEMMASVVKDAHFEKFPTLLEIAERVQLQTIIDWYIANPEQHHSDMIDCLCNFYDLEGSANLRQKLTNLTNA
jgi:hypothetical protein